jgi:hypothetical protein
MASPETGRLVQLVTVSASPGPVRANQVTGQQGQAEIVPSVMANASPGLVTESRPIGLREMVSVSRGRAMVSRPTDLREMVSVSRGLVTENLGIARLVPPATVSVSPGPAMVGLETGQQGLVEIVPSVTVSASPGPAMVSRAIAQLAMVSVSHGHVTESLGIANSETPDRRVRAATALSAITKRTR